MGKGDNRRRIKLGRSSRQGVSTQKGNYCLPRVNGTMRFASMTWTTLSGIKPTPHFEDPSTEVPYALRCEFDSLRQAESVARLEQHKLLRKKRDEIKNLIQESKLSRERHHREVRRFVYLASQTKEKPIGNPKKQSHALKQEKERKAAERAFDKARTLLRKAQRDNKQNKIPLGPQGLLENIGGAIHGASKAPKYVDQAVKLSTAFEQLKNLVKYNGSDGDDLLENCLSRLEDIVHLISACANSRNWVGFVSSVHLYARTHYTGSMTKKLATLILGLFETDPKLKTQAEDEPIDPEKGHENPSVNQFMWNFWTGTPDENVAKFRDFTGNWKMYRNCTFAKKIGQMINILVTFGFLQNATVKMGDFELFRARVWDVQKEGLDFVDVIIDTFSFFLERGYLALAEGDLSLLLFSDKDAARYEEEYSTLVSVDSLLDAGRLNDLKTDKIASEQEFESRLEQLIVKSMMLIRSEKNPHAKATYTNKLVTLKKLRTKLTLLQKASPVRVKPFGLCISGGSSVGKTTINMICSRVLLQHNGFNHKKENIVTLNDGDPYQSEFRSFHTGVTMDDFGNTKESFYEGNPTAKIIDFLNNVPKAALSPIAENKGNIMIRPKLVSVTTNVKQLMANIFSNCPESILRRFECHMTAKLRPEWEDATGSLDREKVGNLFIPDAWTFHLERVVITRGSNGQPDTWKFETIAKDASIFEALDILKKMSESHYAHQDNYVKKTEEFYDMEFCEHSLPPLECPHCAQCETCTKDEPLTHQALDEAIEEPEILLPFEDDEEEMSLSDATRKWYETIGCDCSEFVQAKTTSLREAFDLHKDEVLTKLTHTVGWLGVALVAVGAFRSIRAMMRTPEEQKPTVQVLCQDGEIREFPGETFVNKQGVDCIRFFEDMRPHGFDQEVTLEEARRAGRPIPGEQDHESNWKKVQYADIPRAPSAQTRSGTQFSNMITKNLAYCTVFNFDTNRKRSCNIWPISGNVWLLPGHMIDEGTTVTIRVNTRNPDSVGRIFTEKVDDTKIQRFSDDFMLIRLVKGGSVKNTLDMFPVEDFKFSPEPLHFVTKNEAGVVTTSIARPKEEKVFTTTRGDLQGISYTLGCPTADGMCIAPVYTYRSPHTIIGFHLAGKEGVNYGVAGRINATEVRHALALLDQKNSLGCHSEGEMITVRHGIDFTPSKNIPEDHAFNKLGQDESGQDPCAEVYGSHNRGRSFFKSQVVKSPISDHVREVMKIPRDHGPPKRDNIGKHWQRDIDLMSHPKGDFEPLLFKQARDDMWGKIEVTLYSKPEACFATYPLSHDYILSGADGIAAFNRIPLQTSAGFPFNKSKSHFISVVERIVPGITEAIDFNDDTFMKEILHAEECLANGLRIHTIYRGNLKDEPTKWTKDKIRVFAGCEIVFTYLVRKYYLPLVRLIQNNWSEFECAVGINAHGKQWDELTEIVKTYGEDRIIAGDYAAFDKSASPEAMMASFDILIRMAKVCGYTDRDLTIMRGLATEIAYPIYELDGVIAQMFGSNPSGHPLTVIINNLMNSLYMRYAYYSLHKGEENVPPFHERVRLICYGDDNIMSVHPDEEKFCMKNLVPILNSVGIKYTKADKTAVQETDTFEHLNDVEFLKRGFYYNKHFGGYTAALAVSSIGKSLHNQMKSKTTPRNEIAAQAIHSANTEFAYHGIEEFHKRQPQLYKVAELSGISDLVGELPSFEKIVDKYHNARVLTPMEDEPLILQ